MADPNNRFVGIGAINGDSTIDSHSVKKLNTQDKQGNFKETDGSNNSLLGVGAINGNNTIKGGSLNQLKNIGTAGQQKDVIIEGKKKIPQSRKKTNGSNNKLFGIGAINGNNTVEGNRPLKKLKTTITGEEEIKNEFRNPIRMEGSNNKLYGYDPSNIDEEPRNCGNIRRH